MLHESRTLTPESKTHIHITYYGLAQIGDFVIVSRLEYCFSFTYYFLLNYFACQAVFSSRDRNTRVVSFDNFLHLNSGLLQSAYIPLQTRHRLSPIDKGHSAELDRPIRNAFGLLSQP